MPCPPKPYRFEIMMTLRSSTNPWYEVDCIEPLDGLPEMPRSQKKGQVYRRLKINGMLDVLRETLEREVGYPVKSMRAHVLGKKVA